MRIIISPAKKMKEELEIFPCLDKPQFIHKAERLQEYLQCRSQEELKAMWRCSDALVEQNYQRLHRMNLHQQLTPAILSYEGIQYQYMAPQVMEEAHLNYLQEHVRILSGFYGILKPMDGVTPYRLEMQTKLPEFETKDLYEYWNSQIYESLTGETEDILNLASKEYSRCVERYRNDPVRIVTCVFGELKDGKVKEKGTYAKMARGEMVRFLAQTNAARITQAKEFHTLGYEFSEKWSSESQYVFLK